MADDTDGRTGNIAQRENVINGIKSRIYSARTQAELATIKMDIEGELSGDLPAEMERALEGLLASVTRIEQRVNTALASSNTSGNEVIDQEESRKNEEWSENIKREERLKLLVAGYNAIEKDLHLQSDRDIELLETAVNNPSALTPEQNKRLTGQYENDAERKEAELQAKKEKNGHELAYVIKTDAEKSVKIREERIKDNLGRLKNASLDGEARTALTVENDCHQQVIGDHLKEIQKAEQLLVKIHKKREGIKKLMESSPDKAKIMVRRHYEAYANIYHEEKSRDPNHQGYHELHAMITDLGGHEKLELPASRSIDILEIIKYVKEQQQEDSKQNLINAKVQAMQKGIANGIPPKGPSETPNNVMSKFSQKGKTTKEGWER